MLRLRFPRYDRWEADRTRRRYARPLWAQALRRFAFVMAGALVGEWLRREQTGAFEDPDEARRLLSEKAEEIRARSYEDLVARIAAPRGLLRSIMPPDAQEETELTGPSGARYTLVTTVSYARRPGQGIHVQLVLAAEDFAATLREELLVSPTG